MSGFVGAEEGVNAVVLTYLRYRFTTTIRRRVGGYVALVLIIAVIGGVAMAAVAAARRTQSAFPAALAASHPSEVVASIYQVTSATGSPSTYSPDLVSQIAALPGVDGVETAMTLNAARLNDHAVPQISGALAAIGSVTGLYFDEDRPAIVAGRMADPRRRDELVLSRAAADSLRLHVGDSIPIGFYSNAMVAAPSFGTTPARPALRVDAHVVGIVTFTSEVVQDDTDRLPAPLLFTPALTKAVLARTHQRAGPTVIGLRLAAGGAGAPAAERGIIKLLPRGSAYGFHLASISEAKVEGALRPASVALAVFGGIAGLAVLAVAILLIARHLGSVAPELQVLRAVGASPRMTSLDGVVGECVAIGCGALLAVAVAIALSPVGPIGSVREVAPSRGFAIDGPVVILGGLGLVAVLCLAATVTGYRVASRPANARSPRRSSRPPILVRLAATSRMPPAAVLGVRYSVDPDARTAGIPVRSGLLAAVVGVLTVTTTLTFGSGLHTLVHRPALYGWNWDDLVDATNIVPPQSVHRLATDRNVDTWTGYQQATLEIDGDAVPVLLGPREPTIAPPLLGGRDVAASNEIDFGQATLTTLHKHIGDTVTASFGRPSDAPFYIPPTRLTIVGTMTLPAIGKPFQAQDHLSMGNGAVVATTMLPASFRELFRNRDPTLNGPELVFVRMKPGVPARLARADLTRVAAVGNAAFRALPRGDGTGNLVTVHAVERPAQIVNYSSLGNTPLVLAGGLTLGALAAYGVIIAAMVRQRRRDLAIMKAIGFTRRQIRSVVIGQATATAMIGLAVGTPLGVAAGSSLWRLFASQIFVVPIATVPWLSLAAVVVGTVVATNLVAVTPGRAAARVPTAASLRAE